MKKVCITGVNGFIGEPLSKALVASGKKIRGFTRSPCNQINSNEIEYVVIGDITKNINWSNYLKGYECVIHCAGKAHSTNKNDKLDDYLSINTVSTRVLAEEAVKAGVKRFVFLSSIKVNGESTFKINNEDENQKIFTYNDTPNPKDFYGVSKLEAEKALRKISVESGLELVILRLPLVYGYGVKGNLSKLIKLINLGTPLPFSLIENQRSLIGIDNLIDLLLICIDHKKAPGNTFLVSDNEDLSTTELINYIATAMKRSSYFFPVPISILKFISFILRRKGDMERLIGNLQIDISQTRKILNWEPPFSVDEGIKRMVRGNDPFI